MGWYWWLSGRITPGLLNAQYRYSERLLALVTAGCRWLDIGCGSTPLRNARDMAGDLEALRTRPAWSVGVDVHEPTMAKNSVLRETRLADAAALPFEAGAFDVVSLNMVAEHLERPGAVFAEVSRVLAPGGRLLVHTLNAGSLMVRLGRLAPSGLKARLAAWLEGRPVASVFPTHYRCNDAAAFERLGEANGLTLADVAYVEDAPNTIALGPAVALELCWVRATRCDTLQGWRDNLIAEWVKPGAG